MFKNIFKSIIVISFALCCFSKEYVYGEVENLKKDLIESNLMSAEKAYYKDHPDEFVKQKLITKVTQSIGFKKKLTLNLLLLLCDVAILGTVFYSSYKIVEACSTNDKDAPVGVASLCSTLTLYPIIFFHILLYEYVYNEKFYSHAELQNLIEILDSYNPNLNEIDFGNYKNCIPNHLKPTFDVLWGIYQKSGEDGLRKEWDKIRESVVGNGEKIDFFSSRKVKINLR